MMAHIMGGNWLNVRPGDPAFNVMSNMCDYFELGSRNGDDLWLTGDIVGEAREFVLTGVCSSPTGLRELSSITFPSQFQRVGHGAQRSTVRATI